MMYHIVCCVVFCGGVLYYVVLCFASVVLCYVILCCGVLSVI